MPSRRVLIASADPSGATTLAARLDSLGYSTTSVARTPIEMLTAVGVMRPEIVIIDVALSAKRSPRQLAADVRQIRPAAILFTTSDASAVALRRAGLGDTDILLPTPFTDRELGFSLELAQCRHDRAEQAVDLENRFFAVSIDLLCQLDFSGYFRRLNPAWERTLGFTIDELKSRPFIDLVHPDDRERTLRQNKEVRGGGQALGFENRYLCKDGSYRWLLWNAAADAADHVIYSVARDITTRKAADDERERLVGELRGALAEVKVLRDFLPMCAYCKKVRDDEDYWQSVESYVARHTNTQFSHGICPDCLEAHLEPQFAKLEQK